MTMSYILLICGGVLIAACVFGLIGLLVYHFTQRDQGSG